MLCDFKKCECESDLKISACEMLRVMSARKLNLLRGVFFNEVCFFKKFVFK